MEYYIFFPVLIVDILPGKESYIALYCSFEISGTNLKQNQFSLRTSMWSPFAINVDLVKTM